MLFFGYSAQELRGEIYLLIMVTGKILTVGFAVGETPEFGNTCLKSLSQNQILSGL